jgi:2-polyprenyl-3-methyl-5-hydroxy-6-metoxy-1,4-benzoquinol methylase
MYHQYARKYKDNFKASGYSFSSAWKMRKSLIDHMVQLIDGHKLDILDIGCNNGLTGHTLCNLLNKKGIETNIDGIDFVEEAILIAKSNFNYRDTFVADITDKDLVDSLLGMRKYQAVICCEVFHYLHPKDYDNFFTTIYSRLIPDGYFILVLPNVKSIYHNVKKIYYLFNNFLSSRRFKYYFRYKYDLPLVHSYLQENNFDIVSICGVDLLTNLKMNLKNYNNRIKRLFSTEYAILSMKK